MLMDDFLTSAFQKIRAHCRDGLPGEPVAVLVIAVDADGNEISQVITDAGEVAELLARRAAYSATEDFLNTMIDGVDLHAETYGMTMQ